MKKLCVPLLVLLFLLCQCSSNKSVDDELLKSGMTQIDTASVVPTLMAIVKEYAAAYPGYKCLALESGIVLRDNTGIDAENIYSLGPATMMRYGEYYGEKRLFPSSYIVVDGRIVFINSSNDKLARQDLCRNVYMKHLEIKENANAFTNRFWLIRIGNDGCASIYSKDADKDAGIKDAERMIDIDELRKNISTEDP